MPDRLIDRILATSPTDRRKIHVPEWDVDIYFAPLTRAELEAATPKDGIERPSTTQSLFLLVRMAKDAEGAPLFRNDDIESLRTRADLGVLTRVEAFMWGTVLPGEKEVAKVAATDPPSASA